MFQILIQHLHDVCQARLVGEEHGEVGGEDCLLHDVQRLLVLLGVQAVEDAVGLLLEDGHPHGEVVVLHGGGGVDLSIVMIMVIIRHVGDVLNYLGQRRLDVDHELVVVAAVVQVVADGAHPLAQALQGKCEECVEMLQLHLCARAAHLHRGEDARGGLEDAVDAVADVEAVRPVVVGHGPVQHLLALASTS